MYNLYPRKASSGPFSFQIKTANIWLSLQSSYNSFYFLIESDEVLLKIILESLIHINALNKMEVNLLF